jgi:hypothetical protein
LPPLTVKGAGGEAHILDPKSEGLRDPEARIGQERHERLVALAFERIGTRGQEAADMIVLGHARQGFGNPHGDPGHGGDGEEAGVNAPGQERPEAAVVLVDTRRREALAQAREVPLHQER